MITPTPSEFLEKHCACDEGAKFALKYKTMEEAWDHCPRTDWLLWTMQRLGEEPDRKALRLFACWCVRFTPITNGRTVWDLLTDERSRTAVVVTERFANGDATEEEWSDARSAAADATAASAASAASAVYAAATATAADAAVYAAATATAADAAYYAAATAAADAAASADAYYAAATAATDSAYADADAARNHARKFQADHFRSIFPNPFTA